MKIYLVKTLWRNDCDFNCNTKAFSTEEKAQKYLEDERKRLIEDYNITEEDMDGNEYVSGDFDYFDIWIEECEVK